MSWLAVGTASALFGLCCGALCRFARQTGGENVAAVLMRRLEEAVRCPAFPLFLGRRSCPPEGRVCLGLREMTLEDALTSEPSLAAHGAFQQNERLRMVLEDPRGTARLRDMPISFSPFDRQYGYRAAREIWLDQPTNEHDPMRELR